MRFEVYRDRVGQYRWRFIAANGKIVADSGEGYFNKTDCLGGIDIVKRQAGTARVDDTTAQSGFGRG